MRDDDGKEKEKGAHLPLESLILEAEDGGKEQKGEKEGEEEEVCAICLGPMDDDDEDKDDVICRQQCSHEFHGGCVES